MSSEASPMKKLLTPEEEDALNKFYEQSKAKHGDRFVTLLKSGKIAEQIQKQLMHERGETPEQWSEIEARTKKEEEWKYGSADWTQFDDVARDWPNLAEPPVKRRIRAGLPLNLAEGLNRFLRLESDVEASEFRQNWPMFFPGEFWRYFVRPTPDGAVLASGVTSQEAVATQEAVERLKRELPIPLWRAWQQLLRVAWHTGFDLDSTTQLLNINLPDEHAFSRLPPLQPGERTFEFAPTWDFQRAVLGVAWQNWRAKFCERCGQPFVAERPKIKYCGLSCSGDVIRNRKASYWRLNRKSLNAKRRRKYRASRKMR